MPPDSRNQPDKHTAEQTSFGTRLGPYNSLRVKEGITRCVLASETVGLFLCSLEGTIREANDAFLRMVQHSPEDVRNGSLTWQSLTPPEFIERDMTIGRQVMTTGSCAPFEKQYLRKDGSRVDVIILTSRIYESADFQFIVLVFDISAQKRLDRLAATNVFLDTLLEHIPGLIFVKDARTFRYIRFNKATEAYLGRSREEILNKTDEELFGQREAARFSAHDREMLATGKTIDSYEDFLKFKERDRRLFLSKKIIIPDEAGNPRYILGIAEDVTDKRATELERLALIKEQAAREEAERVAAQLKILSESSALISASLDYHATLQNLASAVVPSLADWCSVEMFTPDGQREALVTKHEGDDAVFNAILKLLAVKGDDEARHAMTVAHTGGELNPGITEDDIRQFTDNPEKRDLIGKAGMVSFISVPLHLRGAILGVLNLVTTKRSQRRFSANDFRLVQELGRHAALALDNARLYMASQNLHRAKDEFLAVLSHELRTPLSVIHGYAEILKTDGAYLTEDERQEFYDIIYRNTEHQTRIVNDLLDVSAIITGKLSFSPQTIDPAKAVASIVQNVMPSAEAKGITLTLRNEGAPATLVADPVRFQQIVWNLLSNAVKFTPQGGRVTASIARHENSFVLEISDTGIGMAPDFLPHVFDRFRQEDGSVTRRFGGLGLGWPSCAIWWISMTARSRPLAKAKGAAPLSPSPFRCRKLAKMSFPVDASSLCDGKRTRRQLYGMLLDVAWPGRHRLFKGRLLTREKCSQGLFVTWQVAGERRHELVGGILRFAT